MIYLWAILNHPSPEGWCFLEALTPEPSPGIFGHLSGLLSYPKSECISSRLGAHLLKEDREIGAPGSKNCERGCQLLSRVEHSARTPE